MTTIETRQARPKYTATTASMQADPEAHHRRGDASESSPGPFPIESARCATYPSSMEWVPDRERRIVPEPMAALCQRCPGRQACLLWALAGDEDGYWAGTTSVDRARMRELGQHSLDAADRLQAAARAERSHPRLHGEGEGSSWWYRWRQCRCEECRTANARARAAERAKAAQRRAVA